MGSSGSVRGEGGDLLAYSEAALVFNGTPLCWYDFYYEKERFLGAYRWIGQTSICFPIGDTP